MRKALWITLGVLVILGIAAYSLFAGTYNQFVTQQEEIRQRWAQVDNQLQRRMDLIPNLVETVKGFAAQERTILEEIANARTKYGSAVQISDKIAAANELQSALARLLVIVENYPTLKSDQTFIRLMDELAGTENRIAVERQRYNEAVQNYNANIRRFPNLFLAQLYGFAPATYYEVPPEAKLPPRVDFTPPRGP
ncbi:MAG: LemA family protein [Candidatus Bipolaricaulota bacterium]|nr:LemA family protein [Candidatus Bipolaricaulota bacterium]MCS7273820.1 LemA family protein [Candidatus Bipolaricaulota bacterium]MDW8110762.1 LemA family protein [Candidatus Bipolaricaulota bacterium]MDW8328380.1 LemA family protein [Candidatus Bipolaricaulota bacterium]